MIPTLVLMFLQISYVVGLVPQPCFIKCKDNYMNGMQLDMGDVHEWTVDMTTPLNSLLKAGRGKMFYRLTRACRRNEEYTRCLSSCPDGAAKTILNKGQDVWHILCHDFKNDSDFRSHIVPCWSDYGDDITRKCDSLAGFLQAEVMSMMQAGTGSIEEHLDNLCKSMYGYDRCFVEENYEFCGPAAARFLVKMNHQTSHTLLDLLDSNNAVRELPRSCKDWLNQKGMIGWQKNKLVQRRLRNSSSSNAILCCQIFIFCFFFVYLVFIHVY